MFKVFLIVAVTVSLLFGTVQPCCFPSQLQTFVDILSFVPKGREGIVTTNASYDDLNKRRAFHFFGQSEDDEFDSIIDYQANVSYAWAKGVCNVSHAGHFFENCYPGGKLVRKSFMGVFPDIIELNTYLIPSEYYRFSFTVGKNCTPVTMESQYDDLLILRLFYNMTLGIKNESVFKPPKICFERTSSEDFYRCMEFFEVGQTHHVRKQQDLWLNKGGNTSNAPSLHQQSD